jgi:hypothetical protein
MRKIFVALAVVLAACSASPADTVDEDIEVLETMFSAFWTGDADTVLPILGRVGADHVASETQYQSLIGASVSTECVGLGDGVTQCDITYSNMFYDEIAADPDVTRKTFTVSDGVVTLLDSRFPGDTELTDSVRNYIIRHQLDPANVCATREVYHVNGEACADLVASHITDWAAWHSAGQPEPAQNG